MNMLNRIPSVLILPLITYSCIITLYKLSSQSQFFVYVLLPVFAVAVVGMLACLAGLTDTDLTLHTTV